MEEKEIMKEEEEVTRYSLNEVTESKDNIFGSQVEKQEEEVTKVENINYGQEYPSLNRIDISTYGENENYFGFKEEDKEEKISSSVCKSKDKEEESEFPRVDRNNISQGLKEALESDLISENNMPLKLIDSSITDYNNKGISGGKSSNKEDSMYSVDNYVDDKESASNLPYFSVIEKCEVKDIIGFHKLYEILYYQENEEKKIKCYRRYDNFDKFNNKLRRRHPYMIIPRLTPKNPLVKIITPEEDFYENRRRQLNFYLNFIAKNEFLSKTKEFNKFTNDAEFDEDFFNSSEASFENTNSLQSFTNIYSFPESSKISDTLTKKIFGVFSGIFGNKDERKLSDEEILLRKLEIHYKGIAEKYKEIKANVVAYLRTIKAKSDGFKQLSNTCFYLKDTLSTVENAKESFKHFYEICEDIAEVNKKHHQITGVQLENKFESFISVLYGLCDAFDRYNEYIKLYESVIKANREARSNKVDNLSLFAEELKTCETFKLKFDKALLVEIQNFIETYNNTFSELMEEFKLLLKSVNSQVKIVSNNIVGVK